MRRLFLLIAPRGFIDAPQLALRLKNTLGLIIGDGLLSWFEPSPFLKDLAR